MAADDIEAPAPPPPGAPPVPPDGGGGGGGAAGGAAHPAPTRVDEPDHYSFLTTEAITGMCSKFEEESKGQSNRELRADFLSLFESAPVLTLGTEIEGALKRRNATDAQVTRALKVIVQGMILEKKLEGTRREEKMEALMDSHKFRRIVMCVPADHQVVWTWLNARFHAQEQLEEERRTSNKAPSMVFSSQNLPEVPSDARIMSRG